MSEDITILKDALSAHLETLTPCELADELSVHNAHIYRARKGDFSPTLIAAMRDARMIPPKPPYQYFKIRRDDIDRAADQIIATLGIDYAYRLANRLLSLQGKILKQRVLEQSTKSEAAKKIEVDEDEYISLEDRGWDW